jgi:hypothetical protein
MSENCILSRYAFLFFLLLLIALGLMTYEAQANTPRYWMYMMEGYSGLDFYCTDTKPYEDLSIQSYEEWSSFAAHPNDLVVYAQLVEVTHCNLDVIYRNDGGGDMFTWRFTEPVTDGHEDHRHFTRGMAWIHLLDFDRNLND